MTTREAILRAVPVFVANPDGDLYSIRTRLEEAGIPVPLAADIIEFLPLAVARALLHGMGVHFEEYYVRQTAQGRVIGEKQLLDEPVYREGLAMADEISGMGEDVLMAVAGQSSEYRGISKALREGSRPEDLSCGPPKMIANNEDRRTFDDTSGGTQPRDKAWWQFWK